MSVNEVFAEATECPRAQLCDVAKNGYGKDLTTRRARHKARARTGGFEMTRHSTTVRATHLLTNAAWFGGSLMGAAALNPAARQGDDSHEQQRGVAGLLGRASGLVRRS